jgi:hypothetical protein
VTSPSIFLTTLAPAEAIALDPQDDGVTLKMPELLPEDL